MQNKGRTMDFEMRGDDAYKTQKANGNQNIPRREKRDRVVSRKYRHSVQEIEFQFFSMLKP